MKSGVELAAKRVTRVKCDVDGLVARIQQVGDRAVKGISTQMHTYGELIWDQAKRNAPKDTGSLEMAIQKLPDRTGINRRLVVTIFVDSSTPYIGKGSGHKQSTKTVGDYALLMEKYLRPYGAGGYSAREGTKSKGAQAGGRFFERALKKYLPDLIRKARQIARRATQR